MRIIISPTKAMRVDNDVIAYRRLPEFLSEAEELKSFLQTFSHDELEAIYGANRRIVELNYERLRTMNLRRNLTPAIFAYEGIQYQYMAPQVFEHRELDYIEEHLRILSGFYGILRPFDGVVPYRLEMQTKLKIKEHKTLYDYWGSKIAVQLEKETDCIVNLASLEYSKVVTKHLKRDVRWIHCTFGELVSIEDGKTKIVEKGTLCKMARGQMVRFMAEHAVTDPNQIKAFNINYSFCEQFSNEDHFVFLRNER